MADKSIAGSIVDLAKLGLLAGAGFLIYKNWGGIKSTAGNIGGRLTSAVNSATDTVGKGVSDLGDLLSNKDVKAASTTEDPEEKNAGLNAAAQAQAMQLQSMNSTPTTTTPAAAATPAAATPAAAAAEDTTSENLPTTNLTGNVIYDSLPDISKTAYDIVSGVGRASSTTPFLKSTNALQIAGGLIGNGLGSLWDLVSGKK